MGLKIKEERCIKEEVEIRSKRQEAGDINQKDYNHNQVSGFCGRTGSSAPTEMTTEGRGRGGKKQRR